MLKIGYNAVYNYVYREKSLIAWICSSPMSHVLSDIQCIGKSLKIARNLPENGVKKLPDFIERPKFKIAREF